MYNLIDPYFPKEVRKVQKRSVAPGRLQEV
jgi:hypothetical protein